MENIFVWFGFDTGLVQFSPCYWGYTKDTADEKVRAEMVLSMRFGYVRPESVSD